MRLFHLCQLRLGGVVSQEAVKLSCGDAIRNVSFESKELAEYRFACDLSETMWHSISVTMGEEIPGSLLQIGALPWRSNWTNLVVREEDLGMKGGSELELGIRVPHVANEEYRSSLLVDVLSDFKLRAELKILVEEERTWINDVQLMYIMNNMRLDFVGPKDDSNYWAHLGTRLREEKTSLVIAHGNNIPWYLNWYSSPASARLKNVLKMIPFSIFGVGENDAVRGVEIIRELAVNNNISIVGSNLMEAHRSGSKMEHPFNFFRRLPLPACPGKSAAVFSVVSQLTAWSVVPSMPSELLFTSDATWVPKVRATCEAEKRNAGVVGCILLYHGGPEAQTLQDIRLDYRMSLDTELTRVLRELRDTFMAVFTGGSAAEFRWELTDSIESTRGSAVRNATRSGLFSARSTDKGLYTVVTQALPGSGQGLLVKIPCKAPSEWTASTFSVVDIPSAWDGTDFIGEFVWDPKDHERVMPIEEDHLLARNVQNLPTFMEENPLANAIADSILRFSEEEEEADVALIDVGTMQQDATLNLTNGTGFLTRSFFRYGLSMDSPICITRIDGANLKVLLESQWGNGEYRITFAVSNLSYLRQEYSSRHRRIFDETILINGRSWQAGRIYGVATVDRLCALLPLRNNSDLTIYEATLMDVLADGRALNRPLNGDRLLHGANAGLISSIECHLVHWESAISLVLSLKSHRKINRLQIYQLLDDDPLSNLLDTLPTVIPEQVYTITLHVEPIEFNSVVLWMNTADWKDQRFHRSLVKLQIPQYHQKDHASSVFLLISPLLLVTGFFLI